MIVDPRAGGNLVSRLLSAANAASVQQGKSFWASRLGKKAVSDKLTLTDDPLLARGLGSRLFDGEGIAARALPLIQKGVFANLYVEMTRSFNEGKVVAARTPENTTPTRFEDFAGELARAYEAM